MYNPRGVLGVSATASPEEIKQAFRQKSLQCHPDLCPPAQRRSAEAAFREIAEAYSILSKGGAHAHGRSYQAGRTRPWQASARPPARFSNAGLAVIICIPLVFTGVLLGQKYPNMARESGRRHGLLNPPVNPWLRDDVLPRQRTWGERGSSST
ncbi:g8348 [Coccomyxa viridis]|uniref:G8348 protein n=1 Tax=Coccomyxa viridis TaxID=1274662 RepID=A0ABP1G048_9CHLO